MEFDQFVVVWALVSICLVAVGSAGMMIVFGAKMIWKAFNK